MELHVGFTGPMGSGKGAAIKALEETGFAYFSLSDEVRKEAERQGIEFTRLNLINVGNATRDELGDMIFAQRVLDQAQGKDRAIYDGIRHTGEVAYFRENDRYFIMIAVTASEETRYQRILDRGRRSDPKTLEEIAEKDLKDRAIGIDDCVKIADCTIVNEGTMEEMISTLFDYLGIQREKVRSAVKRR